MKPALAFSLALAVAGCSSPGPTSPTSPTSAAPASESTDTLSVGDVAPPFSLQDSSGAEVTLASLTASGPAVLVFYRGDW